MSLSITTTPADLESRMEVFSFGPTPGFTSFTYNGTANIGGFVFVGVPTLASFSAPNLVSIDPLSVGGNGISINTCALTNFSAPNLETACFIGIVSNPDLTSLNFPKLRTVLGSGGLGFAVGGNASMTSFSVPLLQTIVGQVEFFSTAITVASFPSLTSVTGDIVASGGLDSMTTLSLPNLVTLNGRMLFTLCTALTTVDLSSYVPSNGVLITFTGCPLNAASVNLILRRCVLNASFTSGELDLGGAAPTGQGITDKATLIGRGVAVNTN
jgi:hypothetical protein